MKRVVVCPHCKHAQNTKSNLKYITCSSCQKKYPNTKDNDLQTKEARTQVKLE